MYACKTSANKTHIHNSGMLTWVPFIQPDIKAMQIQLTGFLDKDTAPFCLQLWKLCLSAQTSPQGVPKELLEAKKQELIQEKVSTFAEIPGQSAC